MSNCREGATMSEDYAGLVESLLALDECCHHIQPCGCKRLATQAADAITSLCERVEARNTTIAGMQVRHLEYVAALAAMTTERDEAQRECAGRLTRDESVFIVGKQAKAEAELAALKGK
jgi:hypothetical protein